MSNMLFVCMSCVVICIDATLVSVSPLVLLGHIPVETNLIARNVNSTAFGRSFPSVCIQSSAACLSSLFDFVFYVLKQGATVRSRTYVRRRRARTVAHAHRFRAAIFDALARKDSKAERAPKMSRNVN